MFGTPRNVSAAAVKGCDMSCRLSAWLAKANAKGTSQRLRILNARMRLRPSGVEAVVRTNNATAGKPGAEFFDHFTGKKEAHKF